MASGSGCVNTVGPSLLNNYGLLQVQIYLGVPSGPIPPAIPPESSSDDFAPGPLAGFPERSWHGIRVCLGKLTITQPCHHMKIAVSDTFIFVLDLADT